MDLYDALPQSILLDDPEYSQLIESSKRLGICVIDFLTLNVNELSKLSARSITEVAKFKHILIDEFNTQYQEKDIVLPMMNITNSAQPFTTGDVGIDEMLGGGIFTHNITEIFGESSTGKSQLLMQLALSVQLPEDRNGLNGKCVYITTEGDLPTQRIEGILSKNSNFNKNDKIVSQENIYTVSCNDLITQEHIINVQLPILLERSQGDIKLVIIDSISHHMRVELESKSFRDSQGNRFYIEQLSENLLSLAKKYSVAIVVANQVGDKPLAEKIEPTKQFITDYDYQLGWLVGWKDSTIMYRHKTIEIGSSNNIHNSSNNSNNTNNTNRKHINNRVNVDDVLSDDEDYMLIEKEVNKYISQTQKDMNQNGAQHGNSHATIKNSKPITNNDTCSGKFSDAKRPILRKKKKLDHRVPNLGLSWANYLSTRILLKKSYKASPMIRRGEIKRFKGIDESSFWQVKRTLQVVFSTFCDTNSITYAITERGIESFDN